MSLHSQDCRLRGSANLFRSAAPDSMHADFCIEAFQGAVERHGKTEIFNTDQGSQFTGDAFTGLRKEAGVRISMDVRGRWMDNVFIERLWRSLQYECVHLHAFETGSDLHAGLVRWIGFYNGVRPHSVFAGRTLDGRRTRRIFAEVWMVCRGMPQQSIQTSSWWQDNQPGLA